MYDFFYTKFSIIDFFIYLTDCTRLKTKIVENLKYYLLDRCLILFFFFLLLLSYFNYFYFMLLFIGIKIWFEVVVVV